MNKNCLIVFRNKKINNFERAQEVTKTFSASGLYFDRITYCAFDDSEEISRTVRDCKGNYDNIVLLCPNAMQGTLKNYCERLFEAQFDNFNTMFTGESSIFVITSFGDSKLKDRDVVDIISQRTGNISARAFVKTVGATPNEINDVIVTAKSFGSLCDFNVTENYSDCTIEIVYPYSLPKTVFDSVMRIIVNGLNERIYALEDITLAQRLHQLLQLRRMKISVAESFTGGGIAKRLVEVPGISEVYNEGLNTYSNISKMKRLGVDELTLKVHGAVSEHTAYKMVQGLIATGDCDIAVATTGIAGPRSDSPMHPVGLVYIGIGTRETVSVYKYELKGNRQNITETAINLALFHVYRKLK